MLIAIYVVFHLITFFFCIVAAKLAWQKNIIDDDELFMVMGIFVPWGVLLFIGALWFADYISDNLR